MAGHEEDKVPLSTILSSCGAGVPPPLVGMEAGDMPDVPRPPPELLPPDAVTSTSPPELVAQGTESIISAITQSEPSPRISEPIFSPAALLVQGTTISEKMMNVKLEKVRLQQKLSALDIVEEELLSLQQRQQQIQRQQQQQQQHQILQNDVLQENDDTSITDDKDRPGTPTLECHALPIVGSEPPPLVPTTTPPLQPATPPTSSPSTGRVFNMEDAIRLVGDMGWNVPQNNILQSSPMTSPPLPQTQLAPTAASIQDSAKLLSNSRLTDFVRDPNCLAWLTKICEEGSDPELSTVFDVVMEEQLSLFTDVVSSPLIPSMFRRLSERQKYQLVEKISNGLSHIAFNMHGTRVIQKIIEQITSKDQMELLAAAVKQQVPQLIKDLNGNHIIQQILQSFPGDVNQFIHEVLLQRLVEFGTHRHGCCVLQRCIEYGCEPQKMALVREVINNGLCLVQDPFGNYLLQYILEMDFEYINVKVIRHFLGNIPALSTNKFASNVIEKCLKIAPDDVRALIIEELCDRTKLPLLLQDLYANYVVQTALHTCNQHQFHQLLVAIRPLMPLIKNTPHGKRIESKLRTRTFDSPAGTKRVGYAGTGGGNSTPNTNRSTEALGVTPDGQWLRGGGANSTGSSNHIDTSITLSTTPTRTPPPSFLAGSTPIGTSPAAHSLQLPSPPDSALSAALGNSLNELITMTPPRQSAQPSPSSTPGSMSSNFRLNANARPFVAPVSPPPQEKTERPATPTDGSSPPEQVSLHPALLFGGLED
eukprot:TRINITY_DN2414_c0_g1_i1.p1 TRINITY_DN2414_c0_g1~~TRINITY_DN2414_c0_g1_i1.p1  ORF type:complete len:763 (+),score=136.15 TRINITY_DN2414_c0_g1_i1:51-2339(+)